MSETARIHDQFRRAFDGEAWHEGAARDTRTIAIPPQGGAVDLDFLVQ